MDQLARLAERAQRQDLLAAYWWQLTTAVTMNVDPLMVYVFEKVALTSRLERNAYCVAKICVPLRVTFAVTLHVNAATVEPSAAKAGMDPPTPTTVATAAATTSLRMSDTPRSGLCSLA
jgi:hypothetical protein